jgi:hypothetical protein
MYGRGIFVLETITASRANAGVYLIEKASTLLMVSLFRWTYCRFVNVQNALDICFGFWVLESK